MAPRWGWSVLNLLAFSQTFRDTWDLDSWKKFGVIMVVEGLVLGAWILWERRKGRGGGR